MIHNLKSLPEYFRPVWDGTKNFEIRKNDRDFRDGDFIILQEWVECSYINPYHLPTLRKARSWDHTGDIIIACISYSTNFEQKEGYVVLGLEILSKKSLLSIPCESDCTPFGKEPI